MPNPSFPEGCAYLSPDHTSTDVDRFSGGWQGLVRYLPEFGEAQGDLHPEVTCYVYAALAAAIKHEAEMPSVRHIFNGNCERCGAAMDVKLYPPDT
jgi:hypothetical protein